MKWKTKTGTALEIHDMTDRHLANTIAWLRRRVDDFKELAAEHAAMSEWSPSTPVESAELGQAMAYDVLAMPDLEFLEWCIPAWPELIKEARQRGFPIPELIEGDKTR